MPLCLTVNQRMADFLELRNQQAFAIEAWLAEEWQRYLARHQLSGPRLLNHWQILSLWDSIIQPSASMSKIFKTRSIAKLVKEANHLCHEWQLPSFEAETEEQMAFLAWSRTYQYLCQEASWIDLPGVIETLKEAHQAGKYIFPEDIQCLGFETLNVSPQLKTFLSLAESSGSRVQHISLVSKTGDIKRLQVSTVEEEILMAAHMALRWRRQAPESRIGIVVPDLALHRKAMVRIFKDILPETDFNIAAPVSLASYPMMDAVLLALRLFQLPLSFEDLSAFLRSPFFKGGMTNKLERAKLEAFLSKRAEETTSLAYLCALPGMAEIFGSCLAIMPTLKSKHLSRYWRQSIQTLLNTLGWPGDRPLNSAEKQQYDKWQLLLTAYEDASTLLGEHTFQESVTHIKYLLTETVFLPSALNRDAPIQILGLLEALGLPFDYLWVMGLHQQSWPQVASANPLIPLKLQKKHMLPRSSSRREYEFAKEVTARLCQGASTVIFSQATLVSDEPCEASALLTAFPLTTIDELGLVCPPSYLKQQLEMQNSKQPILHDFAESAPTLSKTEKLNINAYTLKLQSLCPFRAFAETRLKVKALEKPLMGLRANERGEIVHQILSEFWKEVKDKAGLVALSQTALDECLQDKIAFVLSRFRLQYPSRLQATYLQLEQTRLQALLLNLLALEKTRDAFEVIENEQTHEISIGPLQFNIRIDRVDRLANGDEVLIDYKTGQVSLSDWFAENMPDPQLPLYAVTREKVPVGLVFAIIRADGLKFQGLLNTPNTIPGTKCFDSLTFEEERTWEEQQNLWRENLENLSFAFYEGQAKVEPLQGENTCRLCDLKPLCRVGQQEENV